jgi:hypothetical protein
MPRHRCIDPMRLIAQAERADHRVEDGLGEAAAMVYVGDVYSLSYADRLRASNAEKDLEDADGSVWPFIR